MSSERSSDTIHEHRFDNGLWLLFEPMPWLPTLSATLLMPFGSGTDPTGMGGSGTVLHDWIQRGAGGLDSRAHSDALEGLGVRRGGSAGREAASLGVSFLADELASVLPLVASMASEPRLEEAEFAPARELAQEELASLADAPTQRLFNALMERFLDGGPGRSPYGTREGLAALTPATVREDAGRRLGPRGAILAMAGGAEWQQVLEVAGRAFGSWQGDAMPLAEPALRPPGTQHVRADSAQTQIGVAFPAPAPGDPEVYTYDLALHVLSGSMGARLFTEVREKRGLVYSVGASYRALHGFGYTLGYAGTTPDRADETLRVLLAEIRRLTEGAEADEFERALTGVLSSVVMQGESSGARASRLASDALLQGRTRTLGEIRREVEAVDLERLNGYLQEHPFPEATVVTLGPKPVSQEAAA
ncbi:MAG TPA: pitrilysin family protein [Trueperaceae bacterium]|nr:pitrilysin family protein [Trueperaceae bacterium]